MRRVVLGKYFRKILISYIVLVTLCVTGISLAVYFIVSDGVRNTQYENGRKLFGQIVRNFESIDTTVTTICQQLYYANDDVKSLMFGANAEIDIAASITAMRKIRTVISTNPMIHSLFVFNTWTKHFYPSHGALLQGDEDLAAFLDGRYPYPKLTPLYRVTQNGEPMFTYLQFDKLIDGSMSGGIAVNITAGTFLDAIWPDDGERGNEAVFLITRDAQLSDVNRAGFDLPSALLREVPDLYELGRTNKNGYFDAQMQRRAYTVSYSFMEKPQLLLISVQARAEIMRPLDALRNGVLLIAAVSLVFMALVVLMVSKIIYRPVDRLVRQAGSGGTRPADEISFLDATYSQNRERLARYETMLYSYEGTLKDSWLKKLLTNDADEAEPVLLQRLEDYGFRQPAAFAVCVLRADRFAELVKSNLPKDLALIKFAAINIAMEIFGKGYENYGVDLKEDHVAIVLAVPAEGEAFMGGLAGLAQEGIALINEHLGVSFTASLSGRVYKAGQLAMAYIDAAANSDYRFVLGAGSVIVPEKVAGNKENSGLDFTFENEKAVAEAIRNGGREAVEEAVSGVVNSMTGLIYHNIVISMLHLTYRIVEAVSAAGKTDDRFETEQELNDILRNVSQIETAEQFKARLMSGLAPFLAGRGMRGESDKYAAIVQSISEFVENQYGNPGLCLNQIATMIKMSAKHVNHIFKNARGVSIPKHIVDVRMRRAAAMLENTTMSIKEISAAVGIENQTYFYGIFKSKYGMSPKTYQLDYLMRQYNT